MGSTIAGLKAGVLAGLMYIGSISVANVVILYAAKPAVLQYISENFQQVCPPTAVANSTAVTDCFATIAPIYLPFIATVAFFVSLLYAGIFGRFYEYLPGPGGLKGVTMGAVVAVNLIVFQLDGITFEASATYSLTIFLMAATVAYGFILADLYARYTRKVQFVSEDGSVLRIMVDRRDCTDRTKTFAVKSSHTVRAEAAEGSSFKEWLVSGGVSVEDSRSFETPMEIDGDGVLKAVVSRKY